MNSSQKIVEVVSYRMYVPPTDAPPMKRHDSCEGCVANSGPGCDLDFDREEYRLALNQDEMTAYFRRLRPVGACYRPITENQLLAALREQSGE